MEKDEVVPTHEDYPNAFAEVAMSGAWCALIIDLSGAA
jgi:hypothetical protein